MMCKQLASVLRIFPPMLILAAYACAANSPQFYPDDPIAREPEPADASGVQRFDVHLTWDIVSSLFVKEGDRIARRAQNVNTIDEVPDSSWFTNRVGSQELTASDVAKGPDTTAGPAPGPWMVVAGKADGVRPGFTIMDSAGVRWFLKFDAPGYPEQATAAEVISTKLFWALGYNVAETHVATLWPEDLRVSVRAMVKVNGRSRPFTNRDLRRILDQAARSPDGSYRVLASKELEGKPVGEFLYYGTRSDDPNDVIAHENRRELRGMFVFAAWIDRVDAKAGNTLDTLVTENGKTIVRHHPLDFGSTLGSAGIGPNEYWESYEYLYAGKPLLKKVPGLGFPIERWRSISYPTYNGVGRFEGDQFDPEEWRSRVPNPAYVRADPLDTFWAARKVMAVTDAMIAAAVKAGKYSDTSAEKYMIETLIKRRDAIGRAYLTRVNAIVNPKLDLSGLLLFENAADVVDPAKIFYRAEWFQFDNVTRESVRVGESAASDLLRIQAPAKLPTSEGSFVRVDIMAVTLAHPSWNTPARAYFRRTDAGWKLVGLDRLPQPSEKETPTVSDLSAH
jgi:hypothetical protein